MKNKILTWLFSYSRVLLARLAVAAVALLAGFGVLSPDGEKRVLTEAERTEAVAAAEVTNDRLAADAEAARERGEPIDPTSLVTALVIVFGYLYEWARGFVVTRGTKRVQSRINALNNYQQQGITLDLDGLPFEETNEAMRAAVKKASSAVSEVRFPGAGGGVPDADSKGRPGRTLTGIGSTMFPMLILLGLAFSNVACSSLQLPGGWEEIQSVTDKVAVSGKARPLPDGVELCLQVRRKPDVSEELVEISVEPGK